MDFIFSLKKIKSKQSLCMTQYALLQLTVGA